ncbi:hypothetical protein ADUPG1_010637, partial [Aduncisulcus paluster]
LSPCQAALLAGCTPKTPSAIRYSTTIPLISQQESASNAGALIKPSIQTPRRPKKPKTTSKRKQHNKKSKTKKFRKFKKKEEEEDYFDEEEEEEEEEEEVVIPEDDEEEEEEEEDDSPSTREDIILSKHLKKPAPLSTPLFFMSLRIILADITYTTSTSVERAYNVVHSAIQRHIFKINALSFGKPSLVTKALASWCKIMNVQADDIHRVSEMVQIDHPPKSTDGDEDRQEQKGEEGKDIKAKTPTISPDFLPQLVCASPVSSSPYSSQQSLSQQSLPLVSEAPSRKYKRKDKYNDDEDDEYHPDPMDSEHGKDSEHVEHIEHVEQGKDKGGSKDEDDDEDTTVAEAGVTSMRGHSEKGEEEERGKGSSVTADGINALSTSSQPHHSTGTKKEEEEEEEEQRGGTGGEDGQPIDTSQSSSSSSSPSVMSPEALLSSLQIGKHPQWLIDLSEELTKEAASKGVYFKEYLSS